MPDTFLLSAFHFCHLVICAVYSGWYNDLNFFSYRADPLSNTHVEFASKEDAAAFCERQGNEYIPRVHEYTSTLYAFFVNSFNPNSGLASLPEEFYAKAVMIDLWKYINDAPRNARASCVKILVWCPGYRVPCWACPTFGGQCPRIQSAGEQ